MSIAELSPLVSIAALSVSLFTLWFTSLRKGTVCSTPPAFVAFRYDFVGMNEPQAKIFLRTLLFSTGKRGHVVESLSLRLRHQSSVTEFSFWGTGDKDLVRGSGLFVPETGVASNHHFNPTDSTTLFRFPGGVCSVELVAKVFGRTQLVSLWEIPLEIPPGVYDNNITPNTAIFYSWSPDQGRYIGSIERR